VRPLTVIGFGVGLVPTLMQLVEVESGQSVAAAERALESADGVLCSALLAGVDVLPAFSGRTVSGGRLIRAALPAARRRRGGGCARPRPIAG
jgi:hypothetical protein